MVAASVWDSLDAEEKLTFLVGRVVRSAVELDAVTRGLYATLSNSMPDAAWDAVKQVGPRLKILRALLPSCGR